MAADLTSDFELRRTKANYGVLRLSRPSCTVCRSSDIPYQQSDGPGISSPAPDDSGTESGLLYDPNPPTM